MLELLQRKGSSGMGGVCGSGSLDFAQDDGLLVGLDNCRCKSNDEQRLSWLKGSSGLGGFDTLGVLRLRCASLRMTGVMGA